MRTVVTRCKPQWLWEVKDGEAVLSSGSGQTKRQAEEDANAFINKVNAGRARAAGRVVEGDRLHISNAWRDPGDEGFDFFAAETQMEGQTTIKVRSVHRSTGESSIGAQSVDIRQVVSLHYDPQKVHMGVHYLQNAAMHLSAAAHFVGELKSLFDELSDLALWDKIKIVSMRLENSYPPDASCIGLKDLLNVVPENELIASENELADDMVVQCVGCGKSVWMMDSWSPGDDALCSECDNEVTGRRHYPSIHVPVAFRIHGALEGLKPWWMRDNHTFKKLEWSSRWIDEVLALHDESPHGTFFVRDSNDREVFSAHGGPKADRKELEKFLREWNLKMSINEQH